MLRNPSEFLIQRFRPFQAAVQVSRIPAGLPRIARLPGGFFGRAGFPLRSRGFALVRLGGLRFACCDGNFRTANSLLGKGGGRFRSAFEASGPASSRARLSGLCFSAMSDPFISVALQPRPSPLPLHVPHPGGMRTPDCLQPRRGMSLGSRRRRRGLRLPTGLHGKCEAQQHQKQTEKDGPGHRFLHERRRSQAGRPPSRSTRSASSARRSTRRAKASTPSLTLP